MLTLFLFEESIIGIGIWLVTQLFKVAAFAFKIFMILAQSDILKEIHYDKLITNFYVVLGIIMLFVMAFALLRGIVNPDDQKQGTTVVKSIIINFVISCILLGFLPTIFPFMFDVQDSILRYNVIGGFFGYGSHGSEITVTDNVNEVESSAYRLVNGVFTAFFNVSDGYCRTALADNSIEENTTDENNNVSLKKLELEKCQESLSADTLYDSGNPVANNFLTYKYYVDQTGQFGVYSAFKEQAADDNVSFNFIVLLIAGIALLYIGVSYCFDMGLRLIKLIFYQLIAPIPIFLRIIPNSKFSGTFNQWLKVTLTCWMEVFVRIFIFCFCTWLCSAIMNTNFLSSNVYDYGRTTGLFTQAFILMAIVMFMKRSPKLLSEITGIDSGNMKLGIREKLADGGGFVAGAAIGAGASTLAKNASTSIQNYRNKFQRDENGKVIRDVASGKKILKNGKTANFGTRFWGAVGGVASTAAGTASGLAKGIKASKGAKNGQDMKKAIVTSSKEAVDARVKRASYRAARSTGQGGVVGWVKDTGRVIAGHAKDVFKTGYNFVADQSIEGLNRESQSMGQIVSSYSAFSDGIESLLEKEQSKGGGSVFNGHGFNLQNYKAFDEAAQRKRDIQAKFQSGQLRKMELRDANGNIMRDANGNIMYEAAERRVTEADLRMFEKDYSDAKDNARDELMNMAFAGANSDAYKQLDAKAQAAMQTGMVDAEKFQTTLVANAGSQAVQTVMGASGNGSLGKILSKDKHLEVKDLEYDVNGRTYKLKDVTNVFKGQVDNKIAQMHKEEAAKGEKK